MKGFDFRSYEIILDLGTLDGFHSNLFKELSSSRAKVYSFDPLGERKVKKKYIKENIFYQEMGISDTDGEFYFTEGPETSGGCNYITKDKYAEESYLVKVKTIDTWVKDNKIENVSYIKTDIEGSDLDALVGAKTTIKKFKPDLSICIYHCTEHMFQIPKYILSINPSYFIWFDHYSESYEGSVLYCSENPPILNHN